MPKPENRAQLVNLKKKAPTRSPGMHELEAAERYAIAALFTLALHSATASAERYTRDDWGEDDELYRHSEVVEGAGAKAFVPRARTKIDLYDEYWGRDLAAAGGFLDAVYWQLGLPSFKWQGLKALPGVAGQSTTPEIFRSTVRSLIAVLDSELAAALPAIPVIERQVPKEDVWKNIVGSEDSSDDDVFDITTVHELGGGVKKNTKVKDAEGMSVVGRTGRTDGAGRKDQVEIGDNGETRGEGESADNNRQELEVPRDRLPTQLSEEMKRLELLAAQESHEESRQMEFETLLHTVQEFEKNPLGSPTVSAGLANAHANTAETPGSREATVEGGATDVTKPQDNFHGLQVKQRLAVQGKAKEIPTSAIAIAGVWELLQCSIGASFAASEAAHDIIAYDKERFRASGDASRNSLRRQGPPPCVRWYDARARVALKLVCRWLHVDECRINTLEVLLGNDRAPATSRPGRSQAVSDRYRYWKVGAAAVGGGALFAVTGGLAAPAIAAGVGSILGIVPGAAGAAAASAAGFLSTQAGVAALTTTMATAGAATTGSKMAYRTADVKDFGFYRLGEAELVSSSSMERSESHGNVRHAADDARPSLSASSSRSNSPVKDRAQQGSNVQVTTSEGHITAVQVQTPPPRPQTEAAQPVAPGPSSSSSPWKSWFGTSTTRGGGKEEEAKRREQCDRFSALSPIPSLDKPKIEGINLSTVIGISGWIACNDDYVLPWSRSIKSPASDRYALVWCKSELSNLTSALAGLIAKGVTGQAARYGFQHLLAGASGLVTALGPTVILGAATGLLIDNAWTTAGERAEKAGKLMAHILLQGGTGGRPVTLVAHSLGAKVVMACMEELVAQLIDSNSPVHSIRGLIQDVLIMGTPVTPELELFSSARSIVSGRFINCYSTRDWLLGVLFWEGISKPAAGLSPVDVAGIENINCSNIVSGHAEYLEKLDEVLEVCGMV